MPYRIRPENRTMDGLPKRPFAEHATGLHPFLNALHGGPLAGCCGLICNPGPL